MWLGVIGGLVVAGIVAFAVERLIFRRIYERELTFSMITSFGVLIGGIGVIKFFWGVVPRPVPVPLSAQIDVLGTDVPVYRLVVVAVAFLVYAGIWLFLNNPPSSVFNAWAEMVEATTGGSCCAPRAAAHGRAHL